MHLSRKRGWAPRTAWPALFLCAALLAGCDFLAAFRPGAQSLQATQQPKASSAVELPHGQDLTPPQKFAFYRWLVVEMQEQIFARPLADKKSADGWANVLSQRGSIEGVYHGFILSSEYTALEQGSPANIKALRFYGLERALMDLPANSENDAPVQAAAAKYVTENMNASVFTLKRELGERILREADKRKGDGEKLAAWYSGIAARWAKLDVPFGLAQRNNKDEVFHFQWAKENYLGLIQWELLNREHRILNQWVSAALSQH